MEYSQDRMTNQELGLSLGILTGIVVLQNTGSLFGLFVLPAIGIGLGLLAARFTHSQHPWAEEE